MTTVVEEPKPLAYCMFCTSGKGLDECLQDDHHHGVWCKKCYMQKCYMRELKKYYYIPCEAPKWDPVELDSLFEDTPDEPDQPNDDDLDRRLQLLKRGTVRRALPDRPVSEFTMPEYERLEPENEIVHPAYMEFKKITRSLSRSRLSQ